MPIKARPIDPERARLAARGQLNCGHTKATTTTAGSRPTAPSKRRGNSSLVDGDCNSSSTSSSSSERSHRERKARGTVGRQAGKNEKHDNNNNNNNNTSPAFLTSAKGVESDSETSNSDPELYRAARERTERFLYPKGRHVLNTTSTSCSGNLGDRLNKNEDTIILNLDKESLDSVPPPRAATTKDSYHLKEENQETECQNGIHGTESEDSESPSPAHAVQPLVVQEALRGLQDTTDSASQRDFNRLMDLFAADAQKEREEQQKKEQEEKQQKKLLEDAAKKLKTAASVVTSTGKYQEGDKQSRSEISVLDHLPPPRTFEELQERVLLRLYDVSEEEQNSEYFIASDHMAEAFTFAALEATRNELQTDFDGAISSGMLMTVSGKPEFSRPIGTPLSLMEIIAMERARRNAQAARQNENSELPDDPNRSTWLYTDAETLAANAEESLNRFLLAVHCIETAVRNRRVTDELGRFLFLHHKPFLQTGYEKGSAGDDAIREFPHQAHTVYMQYGRYVSKFLAGLLNRRVPKFNMEEFVLTLYDSNVDGEPNNMTDGECGSMNVLSYPAWRLLESISSFEEFCRFMDDFIAEEYGAEKVPSYDDNGGTENDDSKGVKVTRCDGDGAVVAAGARGIRALLTKTKGRMTRRVTSSTSGDTEWMGLPNDSAEAVVVAPTVPPPHEEKEKEKEKEEEHNRKIIPGGNSARTEFAPVLAMNPNTSLFINSRIPSLSTSTSPPPPPPASSSLLSSQRSSKSLGSVHSFPRLPRGQRRPEAVPGRKLPPLSLVEVAEKQPMISTVPPKLSLSLDTDTPLANASKTAPVPKGRTGRTTSSNRDNKISSERTLPVSTGAGAKQRSNSKHSRSCGGARSTSTTAGDATRTTTTTTTTTTTAGARGKRKKSLSGR